MHFKLEYRPNQIYTKWAVMMRYHWGWGTWMAFESRLDAINNVLYLNRPHYP